MVWQILWKSILKVVKQLWHQSVWPGAQFDQTLCNPWEGLASIKHSCWEVKVSSGHSQSFKFNIVRTWKSLVFQLFLLPAHMLSMIFFSFGWWRSQRRVALNYHLLLLAYELICDSRYKLLGFDNVLWQAKPLQELCRRPRSGLLVRWWWHHSGTKKLLVVALISGGTLDHTVSGWH